MKRRAFISVYDKIGLVDFARNLVEKFQYEIVATGETYEVLSNANIDVINITDFCEASILSNDYNALNEKILAGILANSSDTEALNHLESLAIKDFDTVVVNLKPLSEIEEKTSNIDDIVSEIDIVGITLLRAAAKNYKNVTVITDKQDYFLVMNANEFGRLKLAAKAMKYAADYDMKLFSFMTKETGEDFSRIYHLEKIKTLPYGENKNQKAILFKGSEQVDYKVESENEFKYNDIINISCAAYIVSEFYDVPAVAIVRHTKPCGVAIGKSIYEAYTKAFDCDPLSAYYGVAAFSQKVDIDTAKHLGSMAVEVILAPDFEPEALSLLKENPDMKILRLKTPLKELRNMKLEEVTATPFGVLIQDRNNIDLDPEMFKVRTQEKPTEQQIQDAIFGWKIAKYSRTNAAIVVRDLKTISIGQGHTNTLVAVEHVLHKAAGMAKDAVLVSDCPMVGEDCIFAAIQNRVSLIIQPGGVPKDEQIFEMCDKYGISMITTGIKNYSH